MYYRNIKNQKDLKEFIKSSHCFIEVSNPANPSGVKRMVKSTDEYIVKLGICKVTIYQKNSSGEYFREVFEKEIPLYRLRRKYQ